jgi:sec-independent protein translocase protein TatC
LATYLTIKSGIKTKDEMKALRPYLIVSFFVVAMLLTPPDIFSQLFLALPMWLLFELGLLFSKK